MRAGAFLSLIGLLAGLSGCDGPAPCSTTPSCAPLTLELFDAGASASPARFDEVELIVRVGEELRTTLVRDRLLGPGPGPGQVLEVALPPDALDGTRLAVYVRARFHDEAGRPQELGAALETEVAAARAAGLHASLRPACATAPCLVPGERHGAAMAYDPGRRRVVLFGGAREPDEAPLGDTWEWNGLRWQLVEVPSAPPPRTGHGLAYDAQRERLILFGGQARAPSSASASATAPAFFGDTWEYLGPGDGWRLIGLPGAGPSARSFAAMASGPVTPPGALATPGIVLFGGLGPDDAVLGDTWLWRGAGWQKSAQPEPPCLPRGAVTGPETLPRCRTHAALATVPGPGAAGDMRGALLLGGLLGPGAFGTPLEPEFDELVWRWDGAAWSPASIYRPTTVLARFGHGFVAAGMARPSAGSAVAVPLLLVAMGESESQLRRQDSHLLDGHTGQFLPQLGTAPPPRRQPAMAFDGERGEVLLSGGLGDPGERHRELGDTWSFSPGALTGWTLRR